MKPSDVLHPCGPFYAVSGTISCGCWNCGKGFSSRGLEAHREITTGRVHVHCPHCQAIRLVAKADHLRLWVRRHLADCGETPKPETESWYYWHPDWRTAQWSGAGDGFVTHRLFIGPDDRFRMPLDPDGGPHGHCVPATASEIRKYRANEALSQVISQLLAGRVADPGTRDLAREARLDIRWS